jgi:putative transposase
MGRDKFCELFLELGYGVKRVRNYHRTTYCRDLYYSNLIEGMSVNRPFQVIQSDITYFNLNGEHYYLVFIIDVYTRLIVGYAVSDHMRTEANISALKIAFQIMNCQPWNTIHHSDRGSQYGSHAYTKLLTKQSIHISMGLVAWENPYAGRINGIIKNEYLKRCAIRDFKDLKRKVAKAVNHYDEKRLHRAFKMDYTPMEFHKKLIDLSTQEKNFWLIIARGN